MSVSDDLMVTIFLSLPKGSRKAPDFDENLLTGIGICGCWEKRYGDILSCQFGFARQKSVVEGGGAEIVIHQRNQTTQKRDRNSDEP